MAVVQTMSPLVRQCQKVLNDYLYRAHSGAVLGPWTCWGATEHGGALLGPWTCWGTTAHSGTVLGPWICWGTTAHSGTVLGPWTCWGSTANNGAVLGPWTCWGTTAHSGTVLGSWTAVWNYVQVRVQLWIKPDYTARGPAARNCILQLMLCVLVAQRMSKAKQIRTSKGWLILPCAKNIFVQIRSDSLIHITNWKNAVRDVGCCCH